MKMGLKCLVLLMCFGIYSVWTFAADDETMFTTGKVIKITENGFILDETELTRDAKDAAILYELAPDAKMKYFSALTDLKGDDELDVLYYEKNGERQVILVTLVKD